MKKGFTLVELLGVFTIIASIMLVSVPIVTGMMRKSEEQKYEVFKNNAFLAAEAYISDNIKSYPEMKTVGGNLYISFKRLIENNYLSSTILDPKTGKKSKDELDYTVVATVLSNYTYSYSLSTVKLIVDPIPPVISNIYVNRKTANFTITDNYELEGYAITTSTTTPTVWNKTGSVLTYSNSYSALSPGTYYLHVIDYKGNEVYKSFDISPLAPTLLGTSTIWTKSKTLTIVEPFTKDNVLKYEYIISDSNVQPSAAASITGSTSISGLGVIDSGKYIFVRVVDKNNITGPWGSAENLYVDSTLPTASVTLNGKSASIILNDNSSLEGYSLTTSTTTPTSWTSISGTVNNQSFTATKAGTYYAWVKDIVGNTAYKSFEIAPINFNIPFNYYASGNEYNRTTFSYTIDVTNYTTLFLEKLNIGEWVAPDGVVYVYGYTDAGAQVYLYYRDRIDNGQGTNIYTSYDISNMRTITLYGTISCEYYWGGIGISGYYY